MIALSFDKVVFGHPLAYLGHYIVPGLQTLCHESLALPGALFALNYHSSVGVISDMCSASYVPIVIRLFPAVNCTSPL
jgi:hypothetical protein